MSKTLLKLENLTMKFGGVTALNEVNIEVKEGEILALIGPNGAGKTTTIGKLSKRFQSQGKSVLLAAGDTFRAAAVEQLQEWGSRNNVPVVAQHTGADSASVIFDIGANIGQTALKFSEHFADAQIFSFEPVGDTFKQFKNNAYIFTNKNI